MNATIHSYNETKDKYRLIERVLFLFPKFSSKKKKILI